MGRDEGWQYDCRNRDGHALPSWQLRRGGPVRVSKRENWTDMVERLRPSYPDDELSDRAFKRQLRELAGRPPALTMGDLAKRVAA